MFSKLAVTRTAQKLKLINGYISSELSCYHFYLYIHLYIYMFTDITTLEYGESKSIQLMLCSNNTTPALEREDC